MGITVLHEYRFIDKSLWGNGPWQTEPDKVQWQDEATGLACLAVRHPRNGHWCGYVGVPEGHPLFGVDYEQADRFDVHGGLTFADTCQEDEQEHGICHIPQPGEPDRVWWLGFDMMHAMDYAPGSEAGLRSLGIEPFKPPYKEEYRTLEYVQDECIKLARQVGDVRE